MARHDDPTKRFMEEVAGAPSAELPRPPTAMEALKAVRTAVSVAENPRSAIPKLITKTLVKGLEKDGGVAVDALTMFEALNTRWKDSWHDWEPETLWFVLGEALGQEPHEATRNLVLALQTIVATNAPFEHWHAFEKVGHALTGAIVDFQVLHPMEPDQIAAACRVLRTIRPTAEVEPEVAVYIAVCCHEAGMVFLPEGLFFPGAQVALSRMTHDKLLEARVEEAWSRGVTKSPDQAVDHQLAMLREIKEYAE